MAHVQAWGARISLSPGIPLDSDPFRWTVRCPKCGRETYTVEQLNQQPCKDST